MQLSRGANNTSGGLSTATNPAPSKGIHERLSSELSDSSTDSAMMSLKKPVFNSTSANGVNNVGGGSGGINSTSSSTGKGGAMHQSQHDALALQEGLHMQRRPSQGMIKVKLASASPQWDNKAEVEVDCENPDEVVDKMLQSIVDKFPPTAVITVEKGGKPVQMPHQPGMYGQPTGSLPGSPMHSGAQGSPQHGSRQAPGHRPNQPHQQQPQGHPYQPHMQHMQHPQHPGQMPHQPGQHPHHPAQHPHQPGQQPHQQGQHPGQQRPQQQPHQQPGQSGEPQQQPQHPGQQAGHHPQQAGQQPMQHPGQYPPRPPPTDDKQKHATVSSTASYPMTSQPGSTRGYPMGHYIQEVPKFVPKVEVREMIKEVPRYEVEWLEKIVEIPQISYVDKYEEIPEIHEVVKHVPKFETVDVPREVVKYVPKVVQKIVENVVEVPTGEKIPVVRPQPVDAPFIVPRFQDRNVPVVMSQCIVPEIEETDEVVEVEVSKYVPYLVPVDVYVPFPVSIPVHQKSDGNQTEHPCTNADLAMLQHLMIEMNPHLQQLEIFNAQQNEQFQSLTNQSVQQSREYGVAPPPPIQNATMLLSGRQQGQGGSAGATLRRKSEMSRSSSADASRRNLSRTVSRRVTGQGHRASTSQVPPTMMVPPQQFQNYPWGPPMAYQPMQQMPPTLQTSEGFGPWPGYGAAYQRGSTAGMANVVSGAPPTMMLMSQPPQVNVLNPGGMGHSPERQASKATNPGDMSRQISGAAVA